MNDIFLKFLKASFSTASSHIILNGRPTNAFCLARSVRQGCPLSPLVFILTFDNLSLMLSEAMTKQRIRGVDFPEVGIKNLLTMYVDETSVLMRADMGSVLHLKAILETFSVASGLHCVWEKTKAAFIPGGAPPMEFWLLPWTWKEIPMRPTFLASGCQRFLCHTDGDTDPG